MQWQVKEQNNDAIRLYEHLGGERCSDPWITYHFDKDTILKHATSVI